MHFRLFRDTLWNVDQYADVEVAEFGTVARFGQSFASQAHLCAVTGSLWHTESDPTVRS
jgi:hypothetical protein